MKRIFVLLLVLAGFVLAGCEEEKHYHYGYRDRGRGSYTYRDGRYRDYGRRDSYYGRGYRLSDETTQDNALPQVEPTAQP